MIAQVERQTLTVEEAASLLGISRGAAYQAVKVGEIPGVLRLGRRVLISRVAFERWLSSGDPPADTTDNRLGP